jgi:uncharacterized protein (DUF342 family)
MVNDGRCIIELSADGMSATVTLVPPAGDARALSLDDLRKAVSEAGVIEGVNFDLLAKALESSNGSGHPVRNLVFAKGLGPRPGIPAALIFAPKIQALAPAFLPLEKQAELALAAENAPSIPATPVISNDLQQTAGKTDEHGNIDFRETHGIFIVHHNQLLAIYRDEVQGIPGKTVKGDYVAFTNAAGVVLVPGKNVEKRDDNKLYATKNGHLVWNSSGFWIEETLELAVDVGYKTGNIRFPGNLLLKADIKDRFKVWIGGNLEATGVVDAFEVFCGGNMEAKGGIIGKGKGLVRVQGALNSRFVEHCTVESLGVLTIEQGSLGSRLYSEDSIRTADKGRIVGGEAQALKEVECFVLGNVAGTPTKILLGQSYVVHRKLDFANAKLSEFTTALQLLEERLETIRNKGNANAISPNLLSHKATLHQEIDKAKDLMAEAVGELNDNESASLIVHGTCYAGVVVSICNASLEVTKEMKNVRFVLKKPEFVIVAQPLSAVAKTK